MNRHFAWLGLAVLATALSGRADSIGASFSSIYNLNAISRPSGIISGFEIDRLTFEAGNPNVLLFADFADFGSGSIQGHRCDTRSVNRERERILGVFL